MTELERKQKELDEHSCDCTDSEIKITERTIAGGSTQYVKQCRWCGSAIGSAIKKATVEGQPPEFNDRLRNQYLAKQARLMNEIKCAQIDQDKQRESQFWNEYSDYLESDKWKKKREKVLRRDENVCQGCDSRMANVVHHLTYENLYDEFLFELVAMCGPCHTKLHRRRDERETTKLKIAG